MAPSQPYVKYPAVVICAACAAATPADQLVTLFSAPLANLPEPLLKVFAELRTKARKCENVVSYVALRRATTEKARKM